MGAGGEGWCWGWWERVLKEVPGARWASGGGGRGVQYVGFVLLCGVGALRPAAYMLFYCGPLLNSIPPTPPLPRSEGYASLSMTLAVMQ